MTTASRLVATWQDQLRLRYWFICISSTSQVEIDTAEEEDWLLGAFAVYDQVYCLVFIGPESDHWLCLSLTDSLTH